MGHDSDTGGGPRCGRRPSRRSGMPTLDAPDYKIARFVIERGLAAIYLIAFLVACEPVPGAAAASAGSSRRPRSCARTRVPGRAEPVPLAATRTAGCALVAWAGIAIASRSSSGCRRRRRCRSRCWRGSCSGSLYLSIVNIGGTFYGFGWEIAAARGRLPRDLPRQRRDRAAVARAPAVPLARVPGRVRGGADQAARRPLLARPDLHGLPPRDPADAEPAQLVLPPPAAAAPPARGRSATSSPSWSLPFGLFLPQPIASIAARR